MENCLTSALTNTQPFTFLRKWQLYVAKDLFHIYLNLVFKYIFLCPILRLSSLV